MGFLAFDLGAESGRALFGELDADKICLRELHRFANHTTRMNGHLHWNLPGQWEELKSGLRKARELPIEGIGVSTWGVDFGLLGRGGEILGNPYHYRDCRTDGVTDRAIAKLGRERIFNATGIQFMPINSLYQLLSMRQSRSSLLDAAEMLLFMPDLFNFLLTGKAQSEYTIATTSQMFDTANARWATDLIEALELPTRILPPVVQPGTSIGLMRADVADEVGMSPAQVFAPGCHDTASAVAAVPAISSSGDWCYISSGTWSLMGVEIDRPVINAMTLAHNFTNEGGVGGTIRLLKNIMGLWLVQECRREFAAVGHQYDYAELAQMARDARCDSVIDPDDPPFLAPGEMPQKIKAYCARTGQEVPSTPGEFVRVCLLSLAQAYRRTLDRLEEILGRRIEMIHVVGGGSQNALLNQMTADACGRVVLAGPVEATAAGNILVQAIAAGRVGSLAEARQIVARSFAVQRFEPGKSRGGCA
jgi:rhamnulokinase